MAPRGQGKRHPHKALLLLWLLGRFQQTGSSACTYEDAEEPVSQLVNEFGPPAKDRYRAAYPFFHLESSLWQKEGDGDLSPERAVLRRQRAHGQLHPDVERLLRADPALIIDGARLLLDLHFTPSYAGPICSDVGLNLDEVDATRWHRRGTKRQPRRPGFRSDVLHGWRNRCAMCGYDGAMGREPAGIDAAHVFWHSQGGPDDADNGLALCTIHHVLFDLGALGLSDDMSIVVSPRFVSRSHEGDRLVYALDGRALLDRVPHHPSPKLDHVSWHRTQVFKATA